MTTATRAPKGGITINNVFYKGGQFLPADNEPKRGMYNRNNGKGNSKVCKQEIAPYKWEIPPSNEHRSIYTLIGGIFAKWNDDRTQLIFCANAQTMAYYGANQERIETLITQYNHGQYWTTEGI